MIVMKFGGTSLESAEALERMAQIVATRSAERPFVVVSAMGKTTNELLALGAEAAAGRRAEAISAPLNVCVTIIFAKPDRADRL